MWPALAGPFLAVRGETAVRRGYTRRGTPIEPLIHGAGNERGQRAGNESGVKA